MIKTKKEKLISVIVAAYNIDSYISRCLDSLLEQSYSNMEIIVVDDGSVDRTGVICDQYAARDSRIKVIHQQNAGLSGARNAGLAVSTGAYIGYVDGDDWIEPEMYRQMYTACELQGAELAVCAYREVGNQREQKFSGEQYVLTREEALDVYLCDRQTFHIYNSVWSKLFKREIVEGLRFPLSRKSEDIMYTTYALTRCTICVFLDMPYYNYVMDRPDSIMNQGVQDRRFHDEIPFWKEQIEYLDEIGMKEFSCKAAYYFYRRMLFYYIDFKNNQMKLSCKKLINMLRDEKEKIREIYGNDFVATGDKVRMKLFLLSPICYYLIVKLYDRLIIPMRQ